MNYEEELKRLQENEARVKSGGDFWKPESGQYKVKALGEIEDGSPFEEEGKEPQLRKQLHILTKDKEVLWTFPFGITPASTYGQLISLGKARGQIKDIEFTIVVVGNEKSRRYTIVA